MDTGIGIRKVKLSKLFAPFVWLESPPGTGLGLYLKKHVEEVHLLLKTGGKLEASGN